MSDDYIVRPSGISAALVCPGRMALERAHPTGNEYASVGTIGHQYMEYRLLRTREESDRYLADSGLPLPVQTQMRELANWYGESGLIPSGINHVSVETRRSREILPGVVLAGTPDMVIYAGDDEATIIDWKFYNDPSRLPLIGEDWQMLAYASLVGDSQIQRIHIQRVLCYHLRADVLELRAPEIALTHDAIDEACELIAAGRGTYTPSSACGSCFVRAHCDAFRRTSSALDGLMAPAESIALPPDAPRSIVIDSDDYAVRLEIAAKAAEMRIAEVRDAVRDYVRAKPDGERYLVDPETGKRFGPRELSRSAVSDVAAALSMLSREIPPESAVLALRTSRKAMDDRLKLHRVPKKRRDAVFRALREQGAITDGDPTEIWDWKRPKAQ